MSIQVFFSEVVIKSMVPFVIILLIVAIPHFSIENELYRLLSVLVVNIFSFVLVIWFMGLTKFEKVFVIEIINKLRVRLIYE